MSMSKSDKIPDKNQNCFHREYGLFSNLKYVAKSMFETEPELKWVIFLCIVSAAVTKYLWTFISKFVIDAVTSKSDLRRLIVIIGLLFTMQLIFTMAETYSQKHFYRYIHVRFNEIINKNKKFMAMKYENLEDKDVLDCYEKAGRATGSNNTGVEGMMHVIEQSLTTLAVVIVGFVIMGTLSLPIVIGMILLALANFAVKNHTNKVCKAKIWDPLAPWWRKDGYMKSTFTDFASAKDIRMYSLRDRLMGKYREISQELLNARKDNEIRWWICGQIGNLLWFFAQCGLYAWLIYSVIRKDLSIGNFSLYLGSATTFFNHVLRLLDRVNDALARSREVDDFRSFMDIDADIKEGTEHIPAFTEFEFTFENVWFRYPKAEKYALEDLNLTIKAGKKLAIVGLNGAGKTTFIKLLLRLYEPNKGRILLNGTDIRTYDRKEYYRLFSPVFQDICLFAFPLSMNVSMQTSADTNKDLSLKCLEDAGFIDKVSELPNGIDTEVLKVVDDEGVDFSGGEKQKIALARALYKNAPVIVLDEPTAALDALAEAKLYKDFDRLVSGKTAIYISHRLSSTQFCDNVAMFKDARLIEYGTHDSLLKAGGAYSEMFNVQAQYYVQEGGNVS